MNEEKYLIAGIEDKIKQCEERYMVTNTAFFDMNRRSMAEIYVKKNHINNAVFYGGYDNAERCCMVLIPDYISAESVLGDDSDENSEDNPLTAVRVTCLSGSGKLTHRDYLGAILGLGIKREVVGDILVNAEGADIVVMKEISDYIINNFSKAGHAELSVHEIKLCDIRQTESKMITKSDTVASMRLDTIAASIFGLSRTAAANAVKAGLVFVNHRQIDKVDYRIIPDDVIVYRGKGKAVILEEGGRSRKDRIYIKYGKYV